ncbi:hypothetical protein ACPXCG_23175 [Gordonia sp. DT218]|uniref:hypothetical protein n=1 Tax=unclassified Gordonia (in: high G+C Gram-positive bacteria) TaxID=2657482 RepID=UPI003CEF440D
MSTRRSIAAGTEEVVAVALRPGRSNRRAVIGHPIVRSTPHPESAALLERAISRRRDDSGAGGPAHSTKHADHSQGRDE